MPAQVNVRRPSGASRYQAPSMRLGRSQFDLTHSHKTSFDAGQLIPYFLTEVVPGDTFTCKLNAFLRVFSPLDAPIMDDIECGIDFFFVPNRLVWEHWEEFLGASSSAGAQSVDYTVPVMDAHVVALGDILNYMGVPLGVNTSSIDVSALPVRAYGLIYDEWYRDQNLVDAVVPLVTDAAGSGINTFTPFKSAKKHDYFTSALPYLQKGDASVVTFSGILPVRADSGIGASGTDLTILPVSGTSGRNTLEIDGTTGHLQKASALGSAADQLYVDLAEATQGISINALREAAAVQRLLERDARGGTRHPELIRAHFGVDVPDYRTQRPEYLGGGKGFINVSPVANTSATATEAQGQLAGVAAGTLQASWAKSFVEHGYVLGILRARGQLSYQQGLDRMWSRSTKLDFLWPELAQLGEQAVLNKELYVQNGAADDDVFGYQERYAEYRWKRSLVTGKFASDASGSLDFWHLAEDFGSPPALNQTFIEDQTPMARVTTVDTEPDFIIDGRFDLRVARALPVRPVPTLMPARF